MKKVRVTLPNKRKVRVSIPSRKVKVSIPSRKVRVSLPKAQSGLPPWEMLDDSLESIQKMYEPVDLSPTNTSPGAPAL